MYKGKRCQICTGCGRCQGVSGLQVLTKRLQPFEVNLYNEEKERLVTVDLGTTTIAMQLHRRDGSVEDSFVALNPQHMYGADVVSRIAAAQLHSFERETAPAEHMRTLVLECIGKGIQRFRSKLEDGESLRMVLAANTTMVYLLMGWDTTEIGYAPFEAKQLDALETLVEDVPCFVIPGLSAFVGGDIVAGIHASGMLESEALCLLIDLGTNGEMVLGNRAKIISCATAAGPAFEGGVNKGIWGSDMVKLLARIRKEGLMDETGLLSDAFFETGVRIGNVCITQASVRAVQLAKAAIAAGIEILIKQYGCNVSEIDRVILAGGFGYYINPRDAADIGLLPETFVEKTYAGGNTALSGALWVGEKLIQEKNGNKDIQNRIIDIKKIGNLSTTVINLAKQDDFQEAYVRHMNFLGKKL